MSQVIAAARYAEGGVIPNYGRLTGNVIWKDGDVENLSMTSEFVRSRRPSSLPAFRLASRSAEALVPEQHVLQVSTARGCTVSNLTECD